MLCFFRDEYESFNSDFDGGRLGRTQDALNRYKQRIDANVEHQKEHSGLISTMQNKVAIKMRAKLGKNDLRYLVS